MATIKDVGLVLREEAVGESNKRLTILTENLGKVSAFARGAKGTKSKLAVAKLSYCEFVFYDGKQFLSLTQASQIHSFDKIPSDYDAFCAASFILELTDKMLLPDMPAQYVLNLSLHALSRLNKAQNHKVALAAFIFKLLQKEGYTPTLDGNFFDTDGLSSVGKEILTLTVQAIKHITASESKAVFKFKASQDVADELLTCALIFLRANVDEPLKSEKFFVCK